MKSKIFTISILAIVFCLALPSFLLSSDNPLKEKVKVSKEVAKKLRERGIDPETIEKVVFIHYKGERLKERTSNACYKLLGAKWGEDKLPIDYVVDPHLEEIVPGAIASSIQTWDDATSKKLFGEMTTSSSADWDSQSPDLINEYSLGSYSDQNVIAVTAVWTGQRIEKNMKEIIDYDVLFNSYYPWGNADVNSSVMDLQNIATHETGHGLGLDDVYQNICSAVTMYGYSNYGETQKRTLEPPDVKGLQTLY
jgi:hypothetical protein